MFYLIGLGLGNEQDITVRGLEIVKKCSRVYLEAYTAILGVDRAALETFYGKTILEADRTTVESRADQLLDGADTEDVALLVVGDPLAATTHTDIFLRAVDRGIKCEVVHNASIMNAVASCGLQLYNFGLTVSIPFFDGDFRPYSFYDKIKTNYDNKLHTLCLLDIKVKEPTPEDLKTGRMQDFLPPRFMTVYQALEQLMEAEQEKKSGLISKDTLVMGLARVGQPSQTIIAGSIGDLLALGPDAFGTPLHSLVFPSKDMHDLEMRMVEFYHVHRAQKEQERKSAEQEAQQRRDDEWRVRAAKIAEEQRAKEAARQAKEEEMRRKMAEQMAKLGLAPPPTPAA